MLNRENVYTFYASEICGNIRYAVFPVGDYIVYGGVACVPASLSEKKVKDILGGQTADYEKYLYDSSGREIAFFAGFAVKKGDIKEGQIPKCSLEDTFKMYYNEIKKDWNKVSLTTQYSDPIDVDISEYNKEEWRPEYQGYEGYKLLTNYNESNYQKFIDYSFIQLRQGEEQNGFLSASLPDELKGDFPFKVTSLYGSTIDQLPKSGNTQTDRKEVGKKAKKERKVYNTINDDPQSGCSERGSGQQKEKNTGLFLGTVVVIIVILILILIKIKSV